MDSWLIICLSNAHTPPETRPSSINFPSTNLPLHSFQLHHQAFFLLEAGLSVLTDVFCCTSPRLSSQDTVLFKWVTASVPRISNSETDTLFKYTWVTIDLPWIAGDCKGELGDGRRLGQDCKSLAMFVTVQPLIRIHLRLTLFPTLHPYEGRAVFKELS